MALSDPDRTQMTLGAEIRRRRRERGLTLTQLAGEAGISHSFLSQLERGYARPSMLTLERIARGLGTTQVSLMMTASPADDAATTPPSEALPAGVQMVSAEAGARIPQADNEEASGYSRLLVRGDAKFYPQEIVQRRSVFGPYYSHPQDEWLHVVEGDVEVDLGDGSILRLRSGDSLYYAGGTPHRRRVVGGGVARLLLVQAAIAN